MGKLDKVKNLPPDERIAKLKQIAEEDKKEIEEAQKLMAQSEDEAEEETRKYREAPIPQMKAIDITSLFSSEEKQMFKAKHLAESSRGSSTDDEEQKPGRTAKANASTALENTVEEEGNKFKKQFTDNQQQYIHHLATEVPAREIYRGVQELAQIAHDRGYLDTNQQRRLGDLYMAAKEKEEAMQQGSYRNATYTTSQSIAHTMDLFHDIKKNFYQQ